jgi:tRNA(fMet)-specific endonuclease VapC
MGIRYLLDTNIASCIIKGNSPAVDRRLVKTAVADLADLAISTVTEGELRFGAAAQQYGQLRAALEREGQRMGNLDAMIGAHALALDATLVTNDRAFGRIKKLKTEDWTKGARHPEMLYKQ